MIVFDLTKYHQLSSKEKMEESLDHCDLRIVSEYLMIQICHLLSFDRARPVTFKSRFYILTKQFCLRTFQQLRNMRQPFDANYVL